jgi:ABC-type protease/lipase transport system fused ATPase/permease subunit
MLTETFSSILVAMRKVFANWPALLLVAIVYVALLATLYFLVAVREASIAQVTLTFALAVVAPVLFFVLQAMIASGFSDTVQPVSAGLLARRSLTGFWKFIVITLPLIALAILIVYLLAKYQSHLAAAPDSATQLHPMAASSRTHGTARAPLNW